MKLTQAVRQTALAVAHREGWRHPDVRVFGSPKSNRLTLRVALSSNPTRSAEELIRSALDALRDAQTEDVRHSWPDIEIKVHALVILDVRRAGTTAIVAPDSPKTST